MKLLGHRIGNYVVERELGSGGTGVVYLCRHTLIEREVAVKVLHDDQAHDPDQVARFFREAKAAADIGHPNIIVIIDYGTLDTANGSRTYVMMEALEGQSLDKRLAKGGLSFPEIVHVLRQVASALVACHGKGIVHRDLKPSNIYLCDRSFDPLFVKVLDFGTAKLTAPEPDARRTKYGMVIGTPAYMSPEQCEGKGAIDHRSDVYSLGVMLYEMLTGTLPFDGEIKEILLAHIHATPVPPRERNPTIPVEWEALCLRMMEKSREVRFQSITELAHALDDLGGHAAGYAQVLAHRARSGHSGRTQIAPAPGGEDRPTLHVQVAHSSPAAAHVSAEMRAAYAMPGARSSSEMPAAQPSPVIPAGFSSLEMPAPSHAMPLARSSAELAVESRSSAAIPVAVEREPSQPIFQSFDPRAACDSLVTDPAHAAFAHTLLSRPHGRWSNVTELCGMAGTAQPAALPPEDALWVTSIDHPYPDPSLAAVVFLSLRTGWSHVVLCSRAQ